MLLPVGVTRYSVGDATLVRVPYVDILVDAEAVGLTPEVVAGQPWAAPTWAEGDQVRVAAAVWIIESDDRLIVVDPAQAADDILRTGPDAVVHQEAVAATLDGAGYPRESIDTVIATHIDGIGMIAWRDGDTWVPFFPNAELLISERESTAIIDVGPYEPSGAEAFVALCEQGAVTTVGDGHVVTSHVTTEWTGKHSPGHQLVHVTSGDSRATLIGHLALNPLHLLVDDCALHIDIPGAVGVLRTLSDGRLLAGPLWPTPGAARWTDNGVVTAPPDSE